jgi:hypothetical protein
MANYFLKNADATRVYRLEYLVDEPGGVVVNNARASAVGASAVLPNKNVINLPDMPVDPAQVLVDVVLNALKPATLAEYRAVSKAMLDSFWG